MTLIEAFSFLKIPPTFDKKKLKKAYLKMVNLYHPDKLRNQTGSSQENDIYQINEAYNLIINHISQENNSTLNQNDNDFELKYQGLENAEFSDYASQNEDIIDMLFSESSSSELDIDFRPVFITSREAKIGITKKIMNSLNEEVKLEIPPETIDGHVLIKDGECFEIKIK